MPRIDKHKLKLAYFPVQNCAALKASLAANATHGKWREAGDYRCGYELAVKHRLVAATDSEGVAALLCCTVQWARDFTASEHERERILEDERLRAAKTDGKSNRQIAEEVGLDRRTVDRRLGGAKGNTFDLPHPEADPRPSRADAIKADLAEMESPAGQRYGSSPIM